MIHLCVQADCSYSLFSASLAGELDGIGLPSRFRTIGYDWLFRAERVVPDRRFGHSLLAFANLRMGSRKLLSEIRPQDVVLSYEMFGLVSRWGDGWFHRAVKRRGAKLVCMIQDAWPVLDSRPHRAGCDIRAELSDLVAGVTPNLVSLLKDRYPGKPVVLMEEAIDTDAFQPDFSSNEPIVVWSGPPTKIREVLTLLPVLESVFRTNPFRLRIVSGDVSPSVRTKIPVEWIPFRKQAEGRGFLGGTVAFARYGDREYDRCKGNYKIKTYLAAGCATVTNPIGYNLDMVRPGENGLFASTPGEWESAFQELLSNPDRRLAMRKAARETALRRFSYAAIAKQYADVFRETGLIPR